MTRRLAEQSAHRALAVAYVLGVIARPKRGMRILTSDLAALAHAEAGTADLVVVTDDGTAADTALAKTLATAREAAPDGVLALVVSSPVTRALTRHVEAVADEASAVHEAPRDDAWASARRWASSRRGALAPALEPARFGRIVDAAAACGLALVEAETAIASPPLGQLTAMRSPRARALLATIALGAGARPIFFVPSPRAPKAGLARAKVERLADGWLEASALDAASAPDGEPPEVDLTVAARDALEAAARAGRGPVAFKQLLREARERWSSLAREHGARATPSSRDTRDLASWLYARAAEESVRLYALDPADPGWELVTTGT